MKIKFKITHCKQWTGKPEDSERFWVTLPDGKYFPVFLTAGGLWFHLYNQSINYGTPEAVIAAALKILLSIIDDDSGAKRYRAMRQKEQTFTFTLADGRITKIKMPPIRVARKQRSSGQSRAA